jgi:FtsP/CotA-like multicopper oxidase with cupredoxin domain
MINGVSQANCAYIPASNMVLPERKRSVAPRSLTGGTYYPETNYCENTGTVYFNLTLETGTSYRLRLVNSGTFLSTRFSIDGHNLTVVEVDGTSVEPLTVDGVNLGVAQRASVIVHLDQTVGIDWFEWLRRRSL